MKSFYRLMIASFASVIIASALSFIPKLDRSLKPFPDAPVFRAEAQGTLTDRNLVDLLVKLPLRHSIARAEWNDPILSIDLKISADAETTPDAIYYDFYSLAQFSLSGTKNVKQLLVRAMELPAAPGEPLRLLAAMDAKRSDLEAEAVASDSDSKQTAEQFLNSRFNLTYTHLWLDRFGR